jgi:hypothetical protein
LIRRLRRLQKVLGEYEDLVQFRKLARSLDLRCASGMDKPWRQARLRARRPRAPVRPAGPAGRIASPARSIRPAATGFRRTGLLIYQE